MLRFTFDDSSDVFSTAKNICTVNKDLIEDGIYHEEIQIRNLSDEYRGDALLTAIHIINPETAFICKLVENF